MQGTGDSMAEALYESGAIIQYADERKKYLYLLGYLKEERKTGLEPATYSLGSCRSTR